MTGIKIICEFEDEQSGMSLDLGPGPETMNLHQQTG